MKKLVSILSVLFLLSLTACGGAGKYGDVKDFVNDFIVAQENYISEVEKADSADEVAAALTKFGGEVVKFAEKGKKLNEKYPELENEKERPAELKDIFQKLEESSEKMGKSMSSPKLRKYMMDPKVMKAAMEMGQKFQNSKVFK